MSLSHEYSSERERQQAEWKAVRARLAAAAYVKTPCKKSVEKSVEKEAPALVSAPDVMSERDWLMVATDASRVYSLAEIVKEVCQQFKVSRAFIESDRRKPEVVMPRQTAMMLAKHLTKRSLPQIGKYIGGRDHTTVLHACRKYQPVMDACAEKVSKGAPIGRWVETFKAQIALTPTAVNSKYVRKALEPAN